MEVSIFFIQVNSKELFLHTLPPETQSAFKKFQGFNYLRNPDWYLAGGTALALQTGHRQSVDLDFFTMQADFDRSVLERQLVQLGGWSTTFQEPGTLYGELDGAKVSFIANVSFSPSAERLQVGAIGLVYPPDIAVMKVIAISQRGKKRDFIDLFWYCMQSTYGENLEQVMHRSLRQYASQQEHLIHLLKSLIYFVDAEDDPMPKVNFNVEWETVRHYFEGEVANILKNNQVILKQ